MRAEERVMQDGTRLEGRSIQAEERAVQAEEIVILAVERAERTETKFREVVITSLENEDQNRAGLS